MACSGDGTEEGGQSGAGSSMRLAVTATRGVRRVCGAGGGRGVAASVAHVCSVDTAHVAVKEHCRSHRQSGTQTRVSPLF